MITNRQTVHTEYLRPEYPWEGSHYPLKVSEKGTATHVQQVRDPPLFRDTDGTRYLVYSGAGEELALRIAEIIEEKDGGRHCTTSQKKGKYCIYYLHRGKHKFSSAAL